MNVDPTLPYAVISKESERPGDYYNDGSATAAVGLRIQVFHGQYDAGAAVMLQVKAAFDRGDFPLAGGDKVVDMRRRQRLRTAKRRRRVAIHLRFPVYGLPGRGRVKDQFRYGIVGWVEQRAPPESRWRAPASPTLRETKGTSP